MFLIWGPSWTVPLLQDKWHCLICSVSTAKGHWHYQPGKYLCSTLDPHKIPIWRCIVKISKYIMMPVYIYANIHDYIRLWLHLYMIWNLIHAPRALGWNKHLWNNHLPPWSLTWNLKINPWIKKILFKKTSFSGSMLKSLGVSEKYILPIYV